MSDTNADIWRLSIHESGHALVAHLLGGRVGRLGAWATGGLACVDVRRLPRLAAGAVYAAGELAEAVLADVQPPPPPPERTPAAEAEPDTPEGMLVALQATYAETSHPSDVAAIAELATAGRHWESWTRQAELMHSDAEHLLRRFRADLLRLAEAVHREGAIAGAALAELLPELSIDERMDLADELRERRRGALTGPSTERDDGDP